MAVIMDESEPECSLQITINYFIIEFRSNTPFTSNGGISAVTLKKHSGKFR